MASWPEKLSDVITDQFPLIFSHNGKEHGAASPFVLERTASKRGSAVELDQVANAALSDTQRGADITRKLLVFSGQRPGITESMLANDSVLRLQVFIPKSLTAAINVETHLADDLWPVDIIPDELEDVILNLSLNTRDAMPGNLDGYQLALAAHQIYPTLKILMTSGFTKRREEYAETKDDYLAGPTRDLLSKPCSVRNLALSIRRALDGH